MATDPIIMSERGNRSHIYAETWQPIQVSVSERNTRSIQQTTITITMYILTIIQQEVIHGIQLFNYPHLRLG